MNFLSYLLVFILGACTLTFGVLGLFVTRFLKMLSPICKRVEPYFEATNNSANKWNSKFSMKKKFNKQNAEDVSFEEVK